MENRSHRDPLGSFVSHFVFQRERGISGTHRRGLRDPSLNACKDCHERAGLGDKKKKRGQRLLNRGTKREYTLRKRNPVLSVKMSLFLR